MVCKYFALRRKSRASKFKMYYISGNDEWSYTCQEMLISDIKQFFELSKSELLTDIDTSLCKYNIV